MKKVGNLGFAGWTANILSVRARRTNRHMRPRTPVLLTKLFAGPVDDPQGAAHGKPPCGGKLHWLRAVRTELPGAGHCNAGEKARLGQGEVRHVPRLPAPLPEVCHPVWQPDKEAWAVYQPEWEGAGP